MSTTPSANHAGAPSGNVRVRFLLPEPPRKSLWATLVSVGLHVALILLALRLARVVVEPRGGELAEAFEQFFAGGGGGGGQGGTAVALAAPVAQPTPPPPPEVVVPPPPEIVVPALEPVIAQAAPVTMSVGPPTTVSAGSGTGTGGGSGSGTGTGTGSGVGPGSGGGSGGGVGTGRAGIAPEPRSMMLPPIDSPKSVRGKEVDVTFTVSAEGRVLDILVDPPITDRNFAKKFDEVMRAYGFRPARDADGKAVQGVFKITFTFSS